ncbi:thiol-disulfide isomerase/thioredoxin [Herbihabitans rhizosphaerae]|uniref:Thiol-disulfide isomerase/thioredoxin n=1 Tax=Herbihabitans rhizosphaerae TaxID=1872711 RepID=A0A4Q7L4J1_9PSEU|nr:TlpA disulfide reductase family protein [Herbihabitans rhizosphaerae]RZS44549.1 thiol-disulfide isomerase/thioredoxin [Herbihabitans rhizosphaerae]
MIRRVIAATAACLALAGCSVGTDEVPTGDFSFVAPDGKVELTYEGAERKTIGQVSGESLMEEGKQIGLSDFTGKVVVLNLWGAWCPPCRNEAPELQKVQDQTGPSGVQVLGIDLRDNIRSAPQDFVRDRKLTFPSIYDTPGRSLLGLKGYPRSVVPSTIVLDRQHRVAAIYLREILAADILPLVRRLAAER